VLSWETAPQSAIYSPVSRHIDWPEDLSLGPMTLL
jgi:hypothetical protein